MTRVAGNRLDATVGEHIGLVLRSLTGLHTLGLRDTLDAIGGVHIGLALRSLTGLHTLDLSGT